MNEWIEPATALALLFGAQHLQYFWLRRVRKQTPELYGEKPPRRVLATLCSFWLLTPLSILLWFVLPHDWRWLAVVLFIVSTFWPTYLHLALRNATRTSK
jgi:hypothetical protein